MQAVADVAHQRLRKNANVREKGAKKSRKGDKRLVPKELAVRRKRRESKLQQSCQQLHLSPSAGYVFSDKNE